jgi:ribosomal protein L29
MSEFKDKNPKDLMKALTEKRNALQDFRFGISGGKAKNVKEGSILRKDIARILTELNAQTKTVKASK